MKENNSCENQKNIKKIVCQICAMELDTKYLNDRCPRCNSVIRPNNCANCSMKCK